MELNKLWHQLLYFDITVAPAVFCVPITKKNS